MLRVVLVPAARLDIEASFQSLVKAAADAAGSSADSARDGIRLSAGRMRAALQLHGADAVRFALQALGNRGCSLPYLQKKLTGRQLEDIADDELCKWVLRDVHPDKLVNSPQNAIVSGLLYGFGLE